VALPFVYGWPSRQFTRHPGTPRQQRRGGQPASCLANGFWPIHHRTPQPAASGGSPAATTGQRGQHTAPMAMVTTRRNARCRNVPQLRRHSGPSIVPRHQLAWLPSSPVPLESLHRHNHVDRCQLDRGRAQPSLQAAGLIGNHHSSQRCRWHRPEAKTDSPASAAPDDARPTPRRPGNPNGRSRRRRPHRASVCQSGG